MVYAYERLLALNGVTLKYVDDATLEKIATDLRAYRDAEALLETLRSTLTAKDEEVAELRAALEQAKAETAARHEEAIRVDERERIHVEVQAELKSLLQEVRVDFKEVWEEIRAMRK